MTAGELRQHLDQAHGLPTRGWVWDALRDAHREFHAALQGTATHTHDPEGDE